MFDSTSFSTTSFSETSFDFGDGEIVEIVGVMTTSNQFQGIADGSPSTVRIRGRLSRRRRGNVLPFSVAERPIE